MVPQQPSCARHELELEFFKKGRLSASRPVVKGQLRDQAAQSPPCNSLRGFFLHHVAGYDRPRTVTVHGAPTWVFEEEIRELFEESGFPVYDP